MVRMRDRVNAQFGQRLAHRQRAAFAERAVVFLRAALVAIALDEQLGARIGAQRVRPPPGRFAFSLFLMAALS